jgi:hypothetical protein
LVLVTPYFAFLHVPKTGGSFVRRVLTDWLPPAWFLDTPGLDPHVGWEQLPPSASELPVLSFVRNPWDWYVSWYHYTVQKPRDLARGLLFHGIFDGGTSSFAEVVENACTGRFEHGDGRILRTARDLQVDFYTARLLTVLGTGLDSRRLTIGRFERLVDDLEDFLKEHRVPIPHGFDAGVRAQAPVRVSEHGAYRDYYDPKLRKLVESRARPIIERFGYTF